MKVQNRISSLLIILVILVTSCVQEDDGIYFNERFETSISYTEMEYKIFELVNNHRESVGASRLNILNVISSEAIPHTDYMLLKGEASHDNFEDRFLNLKMNAEAIKVSENVAYGYSTAEAVVQAWLRSPRHKDVIEGEEFTDFGISTKANTEGKNYFTHIFIER
ncbi:MAG: CAP domain-containing protein [Urechidicola sp.]|nr:CAP domain-containing protein [Urechidicola sp.]